MIKTPIDIHLAINTLGSLNVVIDMIQKLDDQFLDEIILDIKSAVE